MSCVTMVSLMQVSYSRALSSDRAHISLGHISASTGWRASEGPITKLERDIALRALTREAEEFGAQGIVEVKFEIETVDGPDQHGAPLRRIVATGEAVRFQVAA
jgi:Putative heavy-metal-binding